MNETINQNREVPKSVYLIISSQVYPIKQKITSLGRKLNNDIVIQDILVSRNHAEIRFENNQFVIYDLKSTGGTYVNNQKADKGILYSGDIILIANVPVMFLIEGKTLEEESKKQTGRLDE